MPISKEKKDRLASFYRDPEQAAEYIQVLEEINQDPNRNEKYGPKEVLKSNVEGEVMIRGILGFFKAGSPMQIIALHLEILDDLWQEGEDFLF